MAAGLHDVARRESTTLYVTLLSAFLAFLHRYTGQHDVVVGSPVAGRTHGVDQGTIGFFVNTLPVRGRISGDPTFAELVARLHQVVMGVLTHQDVPLEKLTEELGLAHEAGYTPLFQVLFNLEPLDLTKLAMPGLEVELVDVFSETAIFDLILTARETGDGLATFWQYSTELFEADTVGRMSEHFARLLTHVVAHPSTRLSELPLLDGSERRTLLVDWNRTDSDYPRDSCIQELFEEQVRLGGDRLALVSGDVRMTYAELNEHANQLAHLLQAEGVHREVPVGLCLYRSVDMVVGLLGILKAGGAYVPLEPDYPADRLGQLVEDSRVAVIVTNASSSLNLPPSGPTVLDLDAERERLAEQPTDDLPTQGWAEDLAYIMYTSGSTGRPKGVCVVHRGVTRLVVGNDFAALGPEETLLQLATISFDVSTFELWGSLLNGGRLVIGPPRLSSHKDLGRIIHDNEVSTLWLTAGLFHNVVDADLEALAGLRQLLVGGDVVSLDHAARFKARFPECRLIDGYGPTENTTFSTTYEITGTETGSVPIGRPIANTTTYVLDEHLHPVPIGVIGDLWTGGDGLARGYLNDPALTADRFVSTGSLGLSDPVIYRTGDRARYRPDGVLLFEGRKDNQVKVNGFRIETEEVEALLLTHLDPAQVTVVPRRSPLGEAQLVAYCVPRPGAVLTTTSLRTFLQDRAPSYLVPSSFVMLGELPLTPQGKVDRRRLPAPGTDDAGQATERLEPRSDLERTIASIWQRVFGLETVGVQDSFFDLGGHSLLAFRFFAALEQETGIVLPLATLFEAPTIERLAALIEERGDQARESLLVPIKPDGTRPPIFFIPGVGGTVLHYSPLARYLSPDQPAFGIEALGLDGKQRPLTRVEEMAARYIREIRVAQPHGPYALAGGSFAGIVAYEMARQLVEMGESVSLLALFDTYLVGPSVVTRLKTHAQVLAGSSPREKLGYLRTRVAGRKRWAVQRLRERAFDEQREPADSRPGPAGDVRACNMLAARRYSSQPHAEQPYPGRVTLFVAADLGDATPRPVEQWDRFVTGGVEKIVVPGTHVSMLEEPHAQVLAERLEQALRRGTDGG